MKFNGAVYKRVYVCGKVGFHFELHRSSGALFHLVFEFCFLAKKGKGHNFSFLLCFLFN